jgi:exosome complex component RRP40
MTLCHKDMDPEMECYNSDTQKSQGFGPIVGGTLVRGSLGWSRR